MSIWTILHPRQQAPSPTTPTTVQEACEDRMIQFVGEMTERTCVQPDELHYLAWLNGALARGLDVVMFPGVIDSFVIQMDHVVARIQDLAAGPAEGDALRMGGVVIEFQLDAT